MNVYHKGWKPVSGDPSPCFWEKLQDTSDHREVKILGMGLTKKGGSVLIIYFYSNQKEIMQNTHDENTRFYKYIVIWAWEFGMLKILFAGLEVHKLDHTMFKIDRVVLGRMTFCKLTSRIV